MMQDESYAALSHIRLILSGAIALYETSGEAIYEKLERDESIRLTLALDGIGEALYWARGKAEKALLHEEEELFAQSAVKPASL